MADAEGRPTDAQELNRQLADTIGASVEQLLGMAPTEADNSKIDAALAAATRVSTPGQPGSGGSTTEKPVAGGPPAAPAAAPATTSGAPAPVTAPEGEIDWESTKAANGLYLGKYKTRAEAVRGVAHTVAMAKNAFTERDEYARKAAALQKELEDARRMPAAAPAVVPQGSTVVAPTRGKETVPSPKLDEVLSSIREKGNLDAEDVMSLTTAIRDQAREEARQIAREESTAEKAAAKAEADRWAKVEAYMAEKYPESMNFTDELALFIKTHPVIGMGVQALIAQDRHEEATAEAWRAYALENGVTPAFKPAPATRENVEKEIRLDAADQVRREAVDAARRDAGVIVPTTGGGAHGVHENASAGPTQDEYDNAVALMRQGDGAKWRALVFGDALNHPLLNG